MAPPILRKVRLTDATVKKLPPGRSWDTEIGGFGVKVYPSGKAQFILRYRSRDRKQRERRDRCHQPERARFAREAEDAFDVRHGRQRIVPRP